MRQNDNNIARRMSLVLWFFVVAVPFYLLGLQFHFSAKGALLSSAIAAAFGGLASLTAKKDSVWLSAVNLSSPFVFIVAIVLFCPIPSALLFGLSLSLLFILLNNSRRSSTHLVSGGRAELADLLQSAAVNHLLSMHRELFRAWSIGTVVAFLMFTFITSPWIAFIPLASIAVALSSVINSSSGKEFK